MFRDYDSFCGEELSEPRPTLKLEDHPLSAVRYYLFNIFAATLHIRGHSSIRNQRTRHDTVKRSHLSWVWTTLLTYYGVREKTNKMQQLDVYF